MLVIRDLGGLQKKENSIMRAESEKVRVWVRQKKIVNVVPKSRQQATERGEDSRNKRVSQKGAPRPTEGESARREKPSRRLKDKGTANRGGKFDGPETVQKV